MGRTHLESNEQLFQLLSDSLTDHENLYRIVFSGPAAGGNAVVTKIAIRPVRIGGNTLFQFSTYDGKKSIVKNHDHAQALREMDGALRIGFRNIAVLKSDATMQLTVLPGGGARMTAGGPQVGQERLDPSHDRKKHRMVTEENAAETLSALGFLTAAGDIKPTMQKKYRQVNEFIRIVEESSCFQEAPAERLDIIDCGCGNAYLTFALYHHLSVTRSRETRLTGIDRDAAAVDRNNAMAGRLGFTGLRFLHGPIGGYAPDAAPGAVLSLHACDTATDDAIAGGISWKSRLIVCAPCCHHHLNHQLKTRNDSLIGKSLSKHGLLLEKLGDAMTDAFRVQILSIMGYRVSTIKFVDPENTERNLLIKAEWREEPAAEETVAQYNGLKGLLRVTPYLEEILGEKLRSRLGAHGAEAPAAPLQAVRERYSP